MSNLCHCGCGQKTNLAPQNNKKWGWIKGKPLRFIRGHSLKIFHPMSWGELNINWKGDLALPNQGRKRAEKRFELGNCELCGKPAFDRHHKNENTLDNDLSNIQMLCRKCHMIEDGRLNSLDEIRRRKNHV